MQKILLIRIPPPLSTVGSDTVVQWGTFSMAGEPIGELHLTAIYQLREAWLSEHAADNKSNKQPDDPDEIVLLLGGTLCFYKHLTINSGQKKHLGTALPYLVEESLAQDIEAMHIVHGFPTKDLQVSVAAIPHASLQSLLALFEEIQLAPNRVLSEMQFLMPDAHCTTLLLDNDAAMVSMPSSEGVTLSYEALPLIFPEHADHEISDTLTAPVDETAPQQPVQVKVYYPDNQLCIPAAQVEEISGLLHERGYPVETFPLAESIFALFAGRYFAFRKKNQLIDFRQGVYKCRRRSNRFARRWWPVGAVAACWLVLELGLCATKGFVYQQQAESLWDESIKSYLSVFPNDRQAQQAKARQQRSFNIKQIMENRLKNLNTQSTETPFLPMLQALSGVVDSVDTKVGLEPRSLDFNEVSGLLVYEFSAKNLEAVNQFLDQLNASDLSGKLDNASQGKTGVIAKVTIRQ